MKTLCKSMKIFILLIFVAGIFPFQALAIEPRLSINNLAIAVRDTTVVVSWETNVQSFGRVDFGKTDSYGLHLEENQKKSSHAITIIGLEPQTLYHYQVTARTETQETKTFDGIFKTEKFFDSVSPTITDVRVLNSTGTTATIHWFTDKPSDSQIAYGKTESYGSTASSGSLVTVHSITLRGLSPATLYHYRVKSKDAQRKIATYTDETFRTNITNQVDTAPLEITNVRPLTENDEYIKDTSATISWQANKISDGTVLYGTTDKLGKSLKETKEKDIFHIITIQKLKPNTRYYFRVQSIDVFGKKALSPMYSLETLPQVQGGESTSSGSSSASDSPQNYGTEVSYITTTGFIDDQYVPQESLTFYSSFDSSFNADVSAGSGLAYVYDNPSITSSASSIILEAGNFTNGYAGYAMKDNFNIPESTIAFWFNPQWSADDGSDYILFDTSPNYKTQDKYLQIIKRKKKGLMFEIEDGSENDFSFLVADTNAIVKNTWNFVAISWRYNGGGARIFYNGRFIDIKSKNIKNILGRVPTLEENFYIGSKRFGGANALVDEFAIFNKSLSDEDIYSLYQGGLSETRVTQLKNIKTNPLWRPQVLGDSNIGEDIGTSLQSNKYTRASMLIRVKGAPDIFSILNGKKHYISGPSVMAEYGYSMSQVRDVTQEYFDSIPYARLLRSPENASVYYLYQRPQKQWLKIALPSPTAFISYPQNYWGDIVVVSEKDIRAYPHAQLIQSENDSSIYYLQGDMKRLVSSSEAFAAHNFRLPEVVTISQVHLEEYKTGDPITLDPL